MKSDGARCARRGITADIGPQSSTPVRRPRLPRRGQALAASGSAGLGDASTPASLRCCGGDRRRRRGQRVVAAAGLREGDDVADRVGARRAARRSGPSRTRCRRAAGRRSRTRRAGSRTSPAASSSAEAHHREDPLLDVAAVDTDRAAADLVAVADDVVGVGQRRARVGVEGVERLRLRRGERVVHRGPGAGADGDVAARGRVDGRLEQRRVDDPEERPGRLVDQPAAAADLQPGRAEQRPRRRRARRRRRRRSRPASRRRASASPARSASERFLATGPPSSPSSPTST